MLKKVSKSTVAQNLYALRAFLKYLMAVGIRKDSPATWRKISNSVSPDTELSPLASSSIRLTQRLRWTSGPSVVSSAYLE
jgi:site-specific recombinase XerD